jgi:predicted DNA-binding antitoxin AbrB/MazE fold protein
MGRDLTLGRGDKRRDNILERTVWKHSGENGMATRTNNQRPATLRVFEAVFEDGVLKPLQDPGLSEHHRFSVQVQELSGRDPESELTAWHGVYDGLSDDEIAEVETIALDRSRFSREDAE